MRNSRRSLRGGKWPALAITAIAAALLGAASVGVAIADSSGDGSGVNDPNPDKSAAVAALSTVASIPSDPASYAYTSATMTTSTSGARPPGDGGGLDARATAAYQLLSQNLNLMSMPTDVTQRPAYVAANADTRHASMADIWGSSVLASQISAMDSALTTAANDPTYNAYSSGRVVIDTLQAESTSRTGDTAQVVFLGHASYTEWDGSVSADEQNQWQVNLVIAPGAQYGWKIHDFGRVTPDN